MISKFFIERPVRSNNHRDPDDPDRRGVAVSLAVAQYPDIVPPTVQVTTRYPAPARP
jgi:HAE1 family hydrophobic/amphiphilic exporter-1